MAERIRLEEMEALVFRIGVAAELLGLVPSGSKIWWVPGGAGTAPSVPVQGPHGRRFAVSFLPDFATRDTTRDAYRALTATNKALAAAAGRITP